MVRISRSTYIIGTIITGAISLLLSIEICNYATSDEISGRMTSKKDYPGRGFFGKPGYEIVVEDENGDSHRFRVPAWEMDDTAEEDDDVTVGYYRHLRTGKPVFDSIDDGK